MKSKRIFVPILVFLVLTGCAAYQLQPLGANHPANPEVLPAPSRAISKTLAYTRADMPSPVPLSAPPAQEQGQATGQAAGSQQSVIGEGKVVATVPNAGQIVVEHGEIKGFMEAMTMGYRVEPPSLLEGLKSGDEVRFTIDVPKKVIVKIEKGSDLAAASPQQEQGSRAAGSQKTVVGEGKVVATVPNASQIVVEHGEIKGFMEAMTMGYRVDPPSLLEGLKSGDKVRFTMDVSKKAIVKIERLQ